MDEYKKVKDLIEELKKFDENYYVKLSGGNGAYGDWATLTVCEDEEDAMWDIGTVIMEESDWGYKILEGYIKNDRNN